METLNSLATELPELSFDERLANLSVVQHGAVSRAQLLDFGTRHLIDNRLRLGALEPVYESVYRVAAVPVTWKQTLLAATMASGKYSVASFRACAALSELPCGEKLCEITSRRHFRVRIDGITPHESYYLGERDITYVDNIPTTRIARLFNDLPLLVHRCELSASDYELSLHEAMRRNLTDVARLQEEHERLGGLRRPGGHTFVELIDGFTPPLTRYDTEPEMRLLMLLRAAGLPEPVPQHRVWISPSRWYDLDLGWPEVRAFAEFNSYKWHGARDKHAKDVGRLLDLQRLGWEGVIVDDDELAAGAEKAIAALRTILLHRAL